MILAADFPAIPSPAVKSLANGDARFWCTQPSILHVGILDVCGGDTRAIASGALWALCCEVGREARASVGSQTGGDSGGDAHRHRTGSLTWSLVLSLQRTNKSTVCKPGALQRQADLQGAFVKIGDFIKFKGCSCGIPREQALLRKSKVPRKSPEKWTFPSLAFYNAPSLHAVEQILKLGENRENCYLTPVFHRHCEVNPRHKTNTCRKNSWGVHFSANTCGACIRTHANTGNIFPGVIFCILAMSRLYSHPRECRKIFLANYLCIGFMPGGISKRGKLCKSSWNFFPSV